ncbi:MAG: LptF/LptG family permease [bacterium]
MKIISRYIIREHLGPFAFALTALTSLMVLNFISRQFGELVGKGLPWSVIGTFFLLSIPFTLALTVPMSVLVAVLYAYTRLASENEITALKANGVSPWTIVTPAIVGGVVMSIALLAFNDQVLPRSNHALKTLTDDIQQTKPTLLLKEQVINSIAEGKFYLKAGKVDQAGGRMKEVVIYDLADPTRRRTIYADSGRIAFASNRVDLDLNLFHGQMQEVSTDKPTQLNRLFFDQDRIRIRNVGSAGIKRTQPSESYKGDREMGVCEMQRRLWAAQNNYESEVREFSAPPPSDAQLIHGPPPRPAGAPEPHGLGWAYCTLLRTVGGVQEAHAEEVTAATLHVVQDTTPRARRDSAATAAARDSAALTHARDTTRASDSTPVKNVHAIGTVVQKVVHDTARVVTKVARDSSAAVKVDSVRTAEQVAARARAALARPATQLAPSSGAAPFNVTSRVLEGRMRIEIAQHARDRYVIEINKKFSLAAACLIFCIVAPPIALRFPRGGVGLVIGVSLAVFALYYVGLIGGESLANKGIVPPFWAMWGTNVILTAVGIVLLFRMGRDSGSSRGGGIREWLDQRRFLRDERRAAKQGAT